MKNKTLWLLPCVLFAANICFAFQGDSTKTRVQKPAPNQTVQVQQPSQPAPTQQLSQPPVQITVTDAYLNGYQASGKERDLVSPTDAIIVKVTGLTAKPGNAAEPPKQLKLYIEGQAMDGIIGIPKKGDSLFLFNLSRDGKNQEIWNKLLASPAAENFFELPVHISIGVNNGAEEASTATLRISRIKPWAFTVAVTLFLAYLFFLLWQAKDSNLLRDAGVDVTALGLPKKTLFPFSLGRCQMAFWFTLLLPSFFFIWLITGNYDIITAGVMGLVGISSLTALTAVAIDANKGQDIVKQILVLQEQQADINITLISLQGLTDPASKASQLFNTNSLAQLKAQEAALTARLNITPQGFFKDILEDVNGVSFHRLQMFIWTLVLGVIFLYSVYYKLTIPEFSATMLAFQGVAAGTYLGFKVPEKQG